MYVTANIANNEGIGFTRAVDAGASYYEVSGNIVRGTPGNQDARIGINPYNTGSGVIKIWNNLVYDFSGNTNFTAGILLDDAQFTHYVYNNTVVDCGNGIYAVNGTVVAKNNLAYGNADNYNPLVAFNAASTNNLSGPAQDGRARIDSPEMPPRSPSRAMPADDFHLGAADVAARNLAANLSADANLAFAVDIDGGPRSAPWDIGADEVDALTQGHYRWRNDDGSEVTATAAVAEDTPLASALRMTVQRVRFEVSNEGGASSAAVTYQLQGARTATCSTGAYVVVPTGAWDWQVTDSTLLTDGNATTDWGGVTNDATTFVAGRVKDAGSATAGITLATDTFTEIEFSVRATATAVAGANYCFRLYDTTNNRPLDAYPVYAQATAFDPTLTLSNLPSGQIADQLTTTTPATITAFRFNLARLFTVTVDTLRVGFTTGGGIANGDVTAGELWEDTNGNGIFDGAGPDTLIQGGVTPAGGVLTFTTNFTPATTGTGYFVRATLSNLVASDTTTFSLAAADIDEVQAGVAEVGSISSAIHTQDPAPPADVYYSIGTSTADLKTGTPTVNIVAGTATFSTAQTGNVGVGDLVDFGAGTRVFIRSVLSQTQFVVHTPTGAVPVNGGGVVNSIKRAFNTIASAVSGSDDGTHMTNGNLVGNGRKLTWVCYNDGPLNIAATRRFRATPRTPSATSR